jgi:hypothetical protein
VLRLAQSVACHGGCEQSEQPPRHAARCHQRDSLQTGYGGLTPKRRCSSSFASAYSLQNGHVPPTWIRAIMNRQITTR